MLRGPLSAVTVLVTMVSLILGAPPARTEAGSHVEDFTTTTYRDPVASTANWDTGAGELRLDPFVRGVVGSLGLGDSRKVAVAGDHAFVAGIANGLHVIDIQDPESPFLVTTVAVAGDAQAVAVAGDNAFVLDTASGLMVFDTTDPTSPVLLGSVAMPEVPIDVTIEDGHAFVADYSGGIQVVDVRDPTTPTVIGGVATTNARGVAIAGEHAFVADGASGLRVLDISDPATPAIVATLTPGGSVSGQGVAVAGDHVFLASLTAGLLVIDVSDPTTPSVVGNLDTPGASTEVEIWGDLALVSDWSSFQMIDISDPTAPTLVDDVVTDAACQSVAVAGSRAFVVNGYTGLQVIEFANPWPHPPGPVGTVSLSGSGPIGVAVEGDHAYLVDSANGGLLVVDISDPTLPALVGTVASGTGNPSYDVAVAGDLAILADVNDGLVVIDVGDPTAPAVVATLATPGWHEGVAVSGDHAYLTASAIGLQVIDISDPTSPVMVGSVSPPDDAIDVAVDGEHAFLASGFNGLQVVDVSDPSNPILVGGVDTPGTALGVAVSGNHAYVADRDAGVHVIDVEDPANPVLVRTVPTLDHAQKVEVSGDELFVADFLGGLQTIDISDPSNATRLGGYVFYTGYDLALAGEHAFVASGSGLTVIPVYQEAFDTRRDRGQSLPVDGTDATIVRARLTTSQTTVVDWELSADGGTSFQSVSPGSGWQAIDAPGPDLLWRSTHGLSQLGTNPTAYSLTLDWLCEAGPITSISDVPGDQGGWVAVDFTRSGYDFTDEVTSPVTGYQIYRRVDDATRVRDVREVGRAPAPSELAKTASASFGVDRVRILDDEWFVLGGGGASTRQVGELPPGTWQVLTWVAARQADAYGVAIPTHGDSTGAGAAWSVNLVTTHTTIPSLWFASAPDSGYSVDDLPPGVPSGLVRTGTELSWDAATEEDFQHHTVYGSSTAELDGTATLIDYTIDTTFDVSSTSFGYYHVTTSDHAGNESEAASVDGGLLSAPDTALPTAFPLSIPGPNPSQRGTSLAFALPVSSGVRLGIYDAGGRRVLTLVDGARPAGVHRVVWGGRDQGGRRVAPGIYFVRIEAGEHRASRRLTVVR